MDIKQNIIDFSKRELERVSTPQVIVEEEEIEPIDIYQRNQDRISDVNNKTFPKGSQ